MKDLDEINPQFASTDVVLVVGANDVTNPAARRPGNAVSGMPILDVDQARSVIVIKRSLGHGYAGIDNELYTDPEDRDALQRRQGRVDRGPERAARLRRVTTERPGDLHFAGLGPSILARRGLPGEAGCGCGLRAAARKAER